MGGTQDRPVKKAIPSRDNEFLGDLTAWERSHSEDNSEQLERLRRNLRRVRSAELTGRQAEMIHLYYDLGLSMPQIAARLGFQSVHYFSRRFRQATGMSPSEYERSVKMLSEGGPAPDESANNVHDSIFPFRPGPPTIGTDSNGTNPQSSSKPKGAH